jgi:uncharacterized protein (TIGR04255 family)
MAQQRHLENAPIKEALIDLRVSLPKDFDAGAAFAALKTRLAERYPVLQEIRHFQAQFELIPGTQSVEVKGRSAGPAQVTRSGKLEGFRFISKDGLDLAQFRADGFTYNRLAPYTAWSAVLPEALRLWELYTETAGPAFVSRVALRYLNQLRLPMTSGDDLGKYLSALPPMPPGAPGGFSGFLSRISTYDPYTGLAANVTQALEGPEPTIILDVDVFKAGEVETSTLKLTPILQTLHHLKNDIFFGSITDDAARMYDGSNSAQSKPEG